MGGTIPSLAAHGLRLLSCLRLELLLVFAGHDIEVHDRIFEDFDHFCRVDVDRYRGREENRT